MAKYVGDSTAAVYTFDPPTGDLAYCSIISNEVVEVDGSTASTKLTNCASQPCTVFALVDTIHPETVNFKIRTTWTGGVSWLVSPQISTVITCSALYTLSVASGLVDP